MKVFPYLDNIWLVQVIGGIISSIVVFLLARNLRPKIVLPYTIFEKKGKLYLKLTNKSFFDLIDIYIYLDGYINNDNKRKWKRIILDSNHIPLIRKKHIISSNDVYYQNSVFVIIENVLSQIKKLDYLEITIKSSSYPFGINSKQTRVYLPNYQIKPIGMNSIRNKITLSSTPKVKNDFN